MVEDDAKDVELTMTALEDFNLANEVIVTRDGEKAAEEALRKPASAVAEAILHPILKETSATELLLRTGEFDSAAEVIQNAAIAHPQDDVALRLLSATQMLRGRTEEALDAIVEVGSDLEQFFEIVVDRA